MLLARFAESLIVVALAVGGADTYLAGVVCTVGFARLCYPA